MSNLNFLLGAKDLIGRGYNHMPCKVRWLIEGGESCGDDEEKEDIHVLAIICNLPHPQPLPAPYWEARHSVGSRSPCSVCVGLAV